MWVLIMFILAFLLFNGWMLVRRHKRHWIDKAELFFFRVRICWRAYRNWRKCRRKAGH